MPKLIICTLGMQTIFNYTLLSKLILWFCIYCFICLYLINDVQLTLNLINMETILEIGNNVKIQSWRIVRII